MFSPSSFRTDSFLDASLGLLSTPAKLLLRTLKLKGSSSSIKLAPFITKCMAGNPLLLSVTEARQQGKLSSASHMAHPQSHHVATCVSPDQPEAILPKGF